MWALAFEDSLWIAPGQLVASDTKRVTRVRTVLEALDVEVTTPDEAREMLDLKGSDKVGFQATNSDSDAQLGCPGPVLGTTSTR